MGFLPELRAFALGAFFASVLLVGLPTSSRFQFGSSEHKQLRSIPRDVSSNIAVTPRRAEEARVTNPEDRENSTASNPCKCSCKEDEKTSVSVSLPLYFSLPIIAILVAFSGLFSGLTLGLMGLDVIGLQIVQRGDNEELARCASKIAPVRENGNLLLCTLLLGNVAVNSAASILTAEIASGLLGFILSTTLILIFGEILPQACCSRHALQVGARTVPIVKLLIGLFYVLTKPMSVVLDWMLGKEIGTIHSQQQLMEMLQLHISLGAVNETEGEMAKKVAQGALSFRDKQVAQVMTPLEDIFMLHIETCLSYETIRIIFESGYTRIPVYGNDKHDYRGLLYTKDLMLADPEDEMKLGDFIQIFRRHVESFMPNTKLVYALNAFKLGGTHMGLIKQPDLSSDTDPRFEILGLITLEDIVEEILQEEIVDETDVYVDVDDHRLVGDGREHINLNLGVFNPIWKIPRERLSLEEIAAITAHLSRAVFSDVPELQLGMHAVEWLVATSAVQTRSRTTELGVDEPSEEDWLYRYGRLTEECVLVLQGRMAMRVGRDGFRTDAGAFSVLAKDALLPRDYYYPDFGAYLGTSEVRFISIHRKQFLKAQALDRDPEALQREQCQLAAFLAGEVSRKDARGFPWQGLCNSPTDSMSPCSNNPTLLLSRPIDRSESPSRRNRGESQSSENMRKSSLKL